MTIYFPKKRYRRGVRGVKEKEKALFETSRVTTAVFKLAVPTVIGQIILVIYNMADTFFVGLTGRDGDLAAVTVCMPAFMFLSAVANLFGVGGAAAIARALGEGKPDKASRASALAFYGTLSFTGVYALGAFLFRHPFVDLLGGTDRAVHGAAVSYLLVTVCVGGVATALGNLFAHLIRAEGRSIHASLGIGLGGVLNIALDPLFMFVLLPRGREVAGAAAATALSNCASLLYFIILLFRLRHKSHLAFRWERAMFRDGVPREIFSSGVPACVMTLFENVSYAVLDKLMSLEGLAAQTGIGVAKKVNMLAHSVVRGIAQGSLPLLAYNFAAGNKKRTRDSLLVAQGAAVGAALICTVLSQALPHPLIGAFLDRGIPSHGFGVVFLRILCLGAPFSACAYTFISFFQAVGEGKTSFFLAILRKGVVDIPLMFLLGHLIPIYGIVWATPAADVVCCAASVVLFLAFFKRHEDELE